MFGLFEINRQLKFVFTIYCAWRWLNWCLGSLRPVVIVAYTSKPKVFQLVCIMFVLRVLFKWMRSGLGLGN